jgi:hypothetical protein
MFFEFIIETVAVEIVPIRIRIRVGISTFPLRLIFIYSPLCRYFNKWQKVYLIFIGKTNEKRSVFYHF